MRVPVALITTARHGGDSWSSPHTNVADRPAVRDVALQATIAFAILKIAATAVSDALAVTGKFEIWGGLYIGTVIVAACFFFFARYIAWHLNEVVMVRGAARVRPSLGSEAAVAGLINSLPVAAALLWQYSVRDMFSLYTHAGALLLSWYAAFALIALRLSLFGAWRPTAIWTGVCAVVEIGFAWALQR